MRGREGEGVIRDTVILYLQNKIELFYTLVNSLNRGILSVEKPPCKLQMFFLQETLIFTVSNVVVISLK